MKRSATLLLFALLLGCRATAPGPVTAPAATEAPRPAEASDEVRKLDRALHWARSSAENRALAVQAYRAAGERLEELAASREPGTWAVALDADETVIDNSEYNKRLWLAYEEHNFKRWSAWVAERQAPPLPGALAFLNRARELGGKIAIVTNRREALCADTRANFDAFEIPYDVILCRGDDGEKEPRWEQVEEGTASPDLPPLEILLWLGDNIEDFPDLDQSLRDADEAALARFGVDYFVLPNPVYGSWLGNPER